MYVALRCIGEAIVARGVRGLAEMVPGGGFLLDVAEDALKRLRANSGFSKPDGPPSKANTLSSESKWRS